jgi:autotransporter-associated beta strand protein
VNFNNNTAFGIGGTISSSSSSAQRNILTPLAAQTPGALVLSQGLTLWNGVFSYSGVAIAPVTFSGNVALGSTTSTIQVQSTTDAGAGTATLTLAGIVSGAGNLAKTGAGVLVLSGANTYSGSTTISAGRLTLGAANTIASSSSVIMAGGTLDPDGFHHAMTATTLGLTASSILDYSSGAAEIDFANSSGVAWTSGMTLNLVSTGGGNWNNSSDYLEVGTATGLTSGQLAEIEFNGTDLGDAGITSQGYIIDTAQIPEPSTVVLSLLGGLGLLWNIRRRAV